jgi:prevent-host-death family protein
MTATIGAFDAKTRLSELLDQVEQGAEFTITKHGRPVARLMPLDPAQRADVAEAIASLRQARRGWRLDEPTRRELRDEGRR